MLAPRPAGRGEEDGERRPRRGGLKQACLSGSGRVSEFLLAFPLLLGLRAPEARKTGLASLPMGLSASLAPASVGLGLFAPLGHGEDHQQALELGWCFALHAAPFAPEPQFSCL